MRSLLLLLCAAFLPFLQPAVAKDAPKIYISADMEGVVGVVTQEQLEPSGFEYGRFREFMTREVIAAIEGARAAGAGEIVVSDSHGNGQNLLLELLPDDIELVRAWPRPLGMMQGIDDSFDGVIFIGYHSSTSNPQGVRAHTFSSARLTDVRLNGTSMPEAGVNAVIAGHFGIPVIMVSGDNVVVKQVRDLLGDIEGTVLKEAYGFHSAKTVMPQVAYDRIRHSARKAVERLGEFEPYRLQGPIELEIDFKNYRASEILSYLSIVERVGSHGIRFKAQDVLEISKFLQFTSEYEPEVSP